EGRPKDDREAAGTAQRDRVPVMNTAKSEMTRSLPDQWTAGEPADALALTEPRAEPADDPSAVADLAAGLAYEEFWQRRAAGEAIDVEEFCNRFPGCRSKLRHVLQLDD